MEVQICIGPGNITCNTWFRGPNLMSHACHPSTLEAEAEGSQSGTQPRLHSETLSQNRWKLSNNKALESIAHSSPLSGCLSWKSRCGSEMSSWRPSGGTGKSHCALLCSYTHPILPACAALALCGGDPPVLLVSWSCSFKAHWLSCLFVTSSTNDLETYFDTTKL